MAKLTLQELESTLLQCANILEENYQLLSTKIIYLECYF